MESELKIVLINAVLTVVFAGISVVHTISIIERGGFAEANPLAHLVLGSNPAMAFMTPALIVAGLTYVSLKIHDHIAMCISSVLLGVTAFDLWTHVYLIL